MSLWTRLGDLFGLRVTITKTYTVREMTPDESAAFDAAFAAMDTAFAEMGKAFDALKNGPSAQGDGV